jgi:hypothetical protein
MQKSPSIAVYIGVVVLMLFPVFCSADARAQGYWQTRYATYSQYDYRNALSPCSYNYPEADWRPFFSRVRHYGPIVHLLPHSPCYHVY